MWAAWRIETENPGGRQKRTSSASEEGAIRGGGVVFASKSLEMRTDSCGFWECPKSRRGGISAFFDYSQKNG
jgi:hypothetical protein